MKLLIAPGSVTAEQRKLALHCSSGGDAVHIERFHFDSSMALIWDHAQSKGLNAELQWMLYWVVSAKIRDWTTIDMRTKSEKSEPFTKIVEKIKELRILIEDKNNSTILESYMFSSAKNPYELEKSFEQRKVFSEELNTLEQSATEVISQIKAPYSKRKKKISFCIYLIDEILLSFKEVISTGKRPRSFYGVVAQIVSHVSDNPSVSDATVRERANNFPWNSRVTTKRRNQS